MTAIEADRYGLRQVQALFTSLQVGHSLGSRIELPGSQRIRRALTVLRRVVEAA